MASDNNNNNNNKKNNQNKTPSENDKRSVTTPGNDIDEKRLNYLDIIRENTNHNKKEILCRIVICGKLNLYDNLSEEEKAKVTQQDLGVYYSSFIKKYQNTDSIITGLFLYSDTVFIHFIEASQRIINYINNDIKNNVLIDMESIKYLYYNDYIENRSFPFWINRSLPKLDKIYIDEEMSDEHIDETVFSLVSNLVSLGEILSSITKDEIKIALEELGTKHSNLIPSAAQLDQLMNPNTNIISLYEWNTLFSPDYGLVLESELTWPKPESLIF